jgi:hypothetical protein
MMNIVRWYDSSALLIAIAMSSNWVSCQLRAMLVQGTVLVRCVERLCRGSG